jgi:hypothetical protein
VAATSAGSHGPVPGLGTGPCETSQAGDLAVISRR